MDLLEIILGISIWTLSDESRGNEVSSRRKLCRRLKEERLRKGREPKVLWCEEEEETNIEQRSS